MHPSIASPYRFVYPLLLVLTLIASSIVVLGVVTDDQGDTGCGGG